ncbi:MAG: hypothetical protein LH614_02545 [Pyrinomonadaceae bacterium]|nr:hypothetical protein [Pyrinomonadaceae bacterium]
MRKKRIYRKSAKKGGDEKKATNKSRESNTKSSRNGKRRWKSSNEVAGKNEKETRTGLQAEKLAQKSERAIGVLVKSLKILKTYKAANGRSNVEKFLIGNQKTHIQQDFTTYMSLLKYWRDESAHGAESKIQEEEAFTSLLLLLHFAQFADSRWQDLTT